MSGHLQLVATLASVTLLLIVLELVRRRRLFERYAILWLLSAFVLIALAVWSGLLELASGALGIAYPPTTLFVIALGFVLMLLLHFSVAVSRLSDQSKVLAQRLTLAEERLRQLDVRASAGEDVPAAVPLGERADVEARDRTGEQPDPPGHRVRSSRRR
jgi:hypothetical protein